jgi:hypothetical protein
MTITIDVPPDIARQLSAEADRQGEDVPEVVRSIVEQRFAVQNTQPYDPAAAIAALDSFDEGDEEEQRETLNTLMKALDRDRPGQRSIFGEGINPMPVTDEAA